MPRMKPERAIREAVERVGDGGATVEEIAEALTNRADALLVETLGPEGATRWWHAYVENLTGTAVEERPDPLQKIGLEIAAEREPEPETQDVF